MQVYGDLTIEKKTSEVADSLRILAVSAEHKTGLPRHEALTELMIDCGAFVQGVLDHEFEARGKDDWAPLEDALNEWMLETASLLHASWKRDLIPNLEIFLSLLKHIESFALPETLSLRVAEGFAFYATYPEMYFKAGETLREAYPNDEWIVIGIRSIGTVLAPLVASSLQTTSLLTLRPVGPVFDRTLQIGETILTQMIKPCARYAIVDEGPGLSGSSFASVAKWLMQNGVSAERLHFLPSHANAPGAFITDENQKIWESISKHTVEFDDLRTQKISCWPFLHLKAAKDISGGLWREIRVSHPERKPPVDSTRERRKYWMPHERDGVVAKFVGLGLIGKWKKKAALALSEEEWIPKIQQFEYGWAIQEWHRWPTLFELDRAAQWNALHQVAKYLAFRKEKLPSPLGVRGATPRELFEMIIQNVSERLGSEESSELRQEWESTLERMELEIQPVFTDNRMHLWEWLVRDDGKVLKCDAFDHALSHDLIGPQDIAWDIAGVIVEFQLSPFEEGRFIEQLKSLGVVRSEPLIQFSKLAYLAFQMGYYDQAALPDQAEVYQSKLKSEFLKTPIQTSSARI